MIKFFTITLCILFSAFNLIAQEVSGDLKNPGVIETEKGYLVFGNTKTTANVALYDKDLNLINKVDQPINKGSRRFFKVEKLSDGYMFEMNFCRLIVDNECNKMEYDEWTRKERKASYEIIKAADPNNYIPNYPTGMITGQQNGIHVENKYVEFLTKETVTQSANAFAVGGNLYKGSSKIRVFQPNERDVTCSYKMEWEIKVNHETIDDFKWYLFGKDQLYLYIQEGVSSFIHKMNYLNGHFDYSYELELGEGKSTAFSNMAIGDDGQLVILGNYIDEAKEKKEYEKKGMDGWFAIKLNERGNEKTKNSFEFPLHSLEDFKGKPFKDKDMGKRCISFQGMEIGKSGHIRLAGENIRIYSTQTSSYPPQELNYWQTYGMSFFKLDNELQIMKQEFHHTLYKDKDFKKGRGILIKQTMYNHNLYDLIMEHEPKTPNPIFGNSLIKYSIEDDDLKGEKQVVIYKQHEKSIEEYTFYYLRYGGLGEVEKGLIKVEDKNYKSSFFLQSPFEYVEFSSSKNKYSLVKKRL